MTGIDKKGFTIIEVFLAAAVVGAVLVTIFSSYTAANSGFNSIIWSAKSLILSFAASVFILNSSGNILIILTAFTPIEPVEPSIERFFI